MPLSLNIGFYSVTAYIHYNDITILLTIVIIGLKYFKAYNYYNHSIE